MKLLTPSQLEFYKQNGYIVLKNVLSEDQLDRITVEYDRLFQRKNQDKMESSWVGSDENDRRSNSKYTVKGIHNLQYHHAVFSEYLHNPRVLDALEDIMQTENIALHHTKAHFKPPEKGAAYPMHQVQDDSGELHGISQATVCRICARVARALARLSKEFIFMPNTVQEQEQDYHYFPYAKDSLVAAFLNLDAASPENGGLFVYPGSHKLGPQEDIGAKEGNYHYVDQTKFPVERATPVITDRGDLIIFSYLLIHGSTPNNSSRPRRMLLSQLYSADDEPIGEQPMRPGQGWMLRGVNVQRDASISKRFEKL